MLYVVRHGHTDWNSKKITMGRKDIPLNDIGIDEAYTTSDVLKDNIFDLIICSPL
ncbi:MAG: histidine phosphatase family protein [Bacilli bacterium]|nr:histidine phosphatase family protein [Bacilli bacterium]